MVRRNNPPKSKTLSEAMKQNTNAAKQEEEKVPEREIINLSFTSSRKERIRNALAWHEGYIPEDEEVRQKAREIAYEAWSQYCAAIERDNERAVIL